MLYFDRSFGDGASRYAARHREQKRHVTRVREHFASHNAQWLGANGVYVGNEAAIIPQDVYREFETRTKELMRAPNLTLLNDLLPMAKPLDVGKVEHVYRQASDSGVVTVDLDGSAPAELDKADYTYDSTIKVVHRSGFGRGWMEIEGQRSEGFDGLVDDQANSVRRLQESIANHIYNGVDVTFKGIDAYGIKTSTKTVDVDLDGTGGIDVDFAASATTAENIRIGWQKLIDALRITNNVTQPITFYVSREIMSNLQRFFSATDIGFGTILDALKRLVGVDDVKEDAQLSGNEVIGVVLDDQYIRPLVGMAVNTVPIARQNPFDPYNFVTWANVGLEIKADYAGRSGVLYARAIT